MANFVDPYLDQETGILRNLVGAVSQEELRKAETDVASMAEIALENVPRTNNLAELQAIHKALLADKGADIAILFLPQIIQALQ